MAFVTREAQRRKKQRDLDDMASFAGGQPGDEGVLCRMTTLVRYFGDQDEQERGEPCGRCDVCLVADGKEILAGKTNTRSEEEDELRSKIVEHLDKHDGQSTGQVYRKLFPNGNRDERTFFDHVLGTLERQGLVETRAASFPKDGERIEFKRAYLTDAGRKSA